jgi:hypothetical protein
MVDRLLEKSITDLLCTYRTPIRAAAVLVLEKRCRIYLSLIARIESPIYVVLNPWSILLVLTGLSQTLVSGETGGG